MLRLIYCRHVKQEGGNSGSITSRQNDINADQMKALILGEEPCFLIISQQIPLVLSSCSGLSNQSSFPPSITMILSQSLSVESRWAMVRRVLSANFSERTFWIRESCVTSMLAVAQSMSTILVFLRRALQIQMSCFSPADRVSLVTFPYSPPLRSIIFQTLHSCATFINSSSLYWLKTSRFCLKVELISTGYWSITVISLRRSFKGMSPIRLPSIVSSPSVSSVMPIRVFSIVVLPDPVRPTIPIFSPLLIMKEMFLRTRGRLERYLTETCLNSISPEANNGVISYSYSFQSLQYSAYLLSGGN